ncbi:sensor histidine kinase [Stenotrophomonas maltophilia]|uniref:histidine kinase n=2 Tax=Stenotrophomonas TaxID=40323 RepID=A0AA40Y275_STEMA|nr:MULTISPECIES: hybrid sensor histidine kinase/response regulator [Stenotrophomonas]AWB77167.1 sensor histidine kinase [Stenotrophomonas maltophilia]KDE91465.1 histidine kinase [Stenotrophomonas maltophilia M30]KOO81433.1 histidine kinase [Stenotrophomonas maltophilia]MBA0340888.1 sensor histidine kinase [Stenotrophomonas maltophilia]MBA0457345.1 sensor histidine kinase [Stenotrophomonas maltophilia]
MPAEAAPVRRLARRSLRVHALLIGVVVLATLQAGLLLSAGSQLFNEERSKIEYHFRRLDGTLREQERFLRQWRLHDVGTHGQPVADASVELQRGPLFANFAVIGSEGASLSPPTELGDRFLRFYGTFWSASRYPPPQCLLVDGQGTRGLLAPVQIAGTDASQNSPHHLRPAIADIHRVLGTRPAVQRGGIVWVGVPWRDRQTWLLAIAHAPQDARLWGEDDKDSQAALACLLDPGRVDDYRQVLGVPVFQRLSLFDANGQRLLGDAADASEAGTSWQAGLAGLQFRMRSERGWLAVYHVGWRQVFQHPQGPLLGATVVALLLALGGTLVLRAYRRSVIEPLRSNHARLLESEAFSRTILDNAPIGLCLLRRTDGNVLLDNALARRWLGEDYHAGGWHGPWRRSVLAAGGTTLGDGLAYATPEGRHLLVTATPARYRGEPAVLCLFIDLSSQHEAEQVLQQARRAADQANRAKSQFLATMSHEIRTPLYGVLGTLELLGLTPLDARQQDYLATIQRSSSTLMQLISDILDVSKAEAGQLSLEPSPFDPVRLTEDALDSYAAAAANKGLQFYACIDADVPPGVCGDAARIRQVLNNLISNALKFTDSGRVVVRVSARWQEQRCWLQWQVADTGIGIASEHQAHLFEPFFQANPGTDAMRGTGLGLAICAHLVALMEGQLRVVSESGLGSSFSVELPLPSAPPDPQQAPPPQLPAGLQVQVRGSVRELVQSLCERLQQRGAQASVYREDSAAGLPSSAVLLELVLDDPLPAWAGGPRVIACREGGVRPRQVDGAWQVGLHRFDAIVLALAAASGQPLAASAEGRLPATRHFGLQVLVAEDNPINQAILRDQLEQLGCRAVVASDGNEALGYWQQGAFALVLTDLNMPGLDGYGLARALRARGVSVPIHGATANADPAERQRCQESGMQGVLVKPITLEALQRLLTRITDGDAPAVAMQERPASTASHDKDPPLQVPAKMQSLFVQTMQADLDSLRQAIAAADPARVAQVLHRIRGALVIVGAPALVDSGLQIEQCLAGGDDLATQAAALAGFQRRLEQLLHPLRDAASPSLPDDPTLP